MIKLFRRIKTDMFEATILKSATDPHPFQSPVLPIEEAVILLKEAEEERLAADIRLVRIFKEMGLY